MDTLSSEGLPCSCFLTVLVWCFACNIDIALLSFFIFPRSALVRHIHLIGGNTLQINIRNFSRKPAPLQFRPFTDALLFGNLFWCFACNICIALSLYSLDMHWSGIFTSSAETHSKSSESLPRSNSEDSQTPSSSELHQMDTPSSDDPCEDPKRRRLDPPSSDTTTSSHRYIMLAIALKNNDVVLWRFSLPVSIGDSPVLLGTFSSGSSMVKSIAWYRGMESSSSYGKNVLSMTGILESRLSM